jgi:predicted ABC-type ATPase
MFIALDSPEQNISRVHNRVAKGGHSVPDADVRRRYARSIANAAQALRLVDSSEFYENSGEAARLVLLAKAGVIEWQADPLPSWVRL